MPLPIDGPSAYLENILEQADLSLIICDEVARNLFDLLSFDKPTWLCSKSLFIGEALVEDLSQPEGAACILFTSGTTGKPKGVVLLHNAIAEFGTGAKASFPLRSDDVILQFSNLSFDASLAEIVNTIAAGATLAIPSQGIINSSADFFQECADLGVTVLNLPAAYWAQLIHEKLELPQTIKIVLVYGESLNFSSLTKWYQTTKKAVLINTYGPTEASIGTSFCHLDKHEHLRSKHQLIGTNFPGKTIHVLDQLERPVPFGAIGEICVAGIGVNAFYISGRGNAPIPVFHNNPQLGRLYRTGDYGQWVLCPDTNKLLLVFHGRKDRQVKISGSRVELEQVENILKMHSEVEDALVLVRDQMNVATLAAFVVKKSGHDVSEFELSELLEKSLPKHCRPSTIHVIDQWPLTLRGKVDKNALLESLGSSIVEDSDSLTVSDELAKIWQNLLATPTIERDSHFFKLGGHSLLAMALVGQVNDRWQAGLTLRQVIESPNFAAMARCIQKSIECKNKVQVRKIPLNQDRGPLNYAQDALLLIDRVGSGNSIEYNVAFSIPIRSDVDDQAIKLAINHVLKRHRALRTVFSWEGGKPSQTIVPVNIDLRRERVSFADFEEITKDDARKPFRLSETPPLRIRFFEITDRSELLLYFNLHHIIHDGFSIRILLEEIFKTYHAIQSGQKELLPDFRASYLDFSFAIRQKVENERDPHDGSSNSIVLESFHLKKLRQQCLTERVGFFAVLFSGAMFALRQISSEEDVTVGSVMSIRDDQEYMGLVGIFVNTVLLRNSAPHEATTMREYFRQEHNSIVDVMSFRHAPLTMLINEQCLPRDATEHKVFDVMVNYHPFGTLFEPADSDLFNGKVQFVDNKTTTVGLGIDLYDWGSSLQIRLGYCRNLYDSDDIANLAKNIRDLLIKVSQLDWSIDYRILSTPATEG
ncbi:MAG: condensation domain-containing protein [Proteobacteria bacterium]|nr:condensation domain-containing protein [Pseudomonadota bacterium]